MKTNLAIFFVLSLIKDHQFLKLPSGFQKCDIRKPDCDRCLSKAIQGAIEQLKQPIDDYGLPQMEPFIAPKSVGCELGNEADGIRQKYYNYKISGLTNIVKTDAKLDYSRRTLTLTLFYNNVTFDFDYQLVGRIIVLYVNTTTTATSTMIKPTFKLKFTLGEYEKDNEKYLKVEDTVLRMDAKSGTVLFRNLFKNERLNEDINIALEESWEENLEYWQQKFPKIFSDPFENIFNNLLERVPVKELIDGLE
ncbi:hypothetical protein Zmor_009984 [Zophobas morio]|uniref:Circadian clock-controlled protein n=1 Tax=Zophobas morio TaxID=2755281 RepID=A0AA38IN20_9CUCU|nr:hypothetical protein Zmor_009984 [Zophobas morio]